MTNPQINISSLTFDDIKSSLKTYITQNGSPFQSYVGSAFDSLLDVFAYNTLFYSYYSNMIANETFLDTATIENNIVSLVKPLGVLVGGKSSSSKSITATSTETIITISAYFTAFSGSNNTSSYNFYTIGDIPVTSEPTTMDIYEAKTVVKNLVITTDIIKQNAFLGNTNIDINTLTVKVNGVVWSKYNNSQTNPGADSQTYFIDRTSSGFYLIFGKKTLNDYQSSFGKSITYSDVVTVSYLVPSGEIANGVSIVSNANVTISDQTVSSGGTDAVDLDLIRYFAPKMFSANDRAVTRDDYIGLLLNSKLLPSNISTERLINIWGGEEADPPAYGRVFVSFANSLLTKNTPSVVSCINYLKSKSMVTIIPEYTGMQLIGVELSVSYSGGTDTGAVIKSTIEKYYNTTKEGFNNSVIVSDIVSLIRALPNSASAAINITNTKLTLAVFGSSSSKNVYFKNKLKIPTTQAAGQVISTEIFSYGGQNITLKDIITSGTNEGNLYGFNTSNNNIGILGYINYENGYVTIKPNVLPTYEETKITAIPANINKIDIKNELVPEITATVVMS